MVLRKIRLGTEVVIYMTLLLNRYISEAVRDPEVRARDESGLVPKSGERL